MLPEFGAGLIQMINFRVISTNAITINGATNPLRYSQPGRMYWDEGGTELAREAS